MGFLGVLLALSSLLVFVGVSRVEAQAESSPDVAADGGGALPSQEALPARSDGGWRRVRRWRRPGARKHEGLMLRLSGGIGFAEVEHPPGSEGMPERSYRDVAMMFEASLGGSVARNWILHGTVTGHGLAQPRVTEDGIDIGRPRRNLRVGTFGMGVTHYFGKSNVYTSGGIGLAGLRLVGDAESAWRSELGLAFMIALGKEWWVGAGNWGLGCALRFQAAGASADIEPGVPVQVRSSLLGLAFSATYD